MRDPQALSPTPTVHASRSLSPRGRGMLAAADDAAAVRAFLAEYADVPATVRAYTRECQRLLLWARQARHKSLGQLTREDFTAYDAFMADPQPASVWCGRPGGRGNRRASPGWRPFAGPLSAAGRHAAFVILSCLFNYLVQARYLEANPLALMRRRRAAGHREGLRHRIVRRSFDDAQWGALIDHLDAGCHGARAAYFERAHFWVACLFFLALRIGELERHTMGSFRQLRGHWSFWVVGKGRREAALPVPPPLLVALQRYRHMLGLAGLPTPDDGRPLLLDASGVRAVGARRANQVLKDVCFGAAARLDGDAPHLAGHMRQASAHWFRHTSITRQARLGMHLRHLQANARHARVDTTMLYVHLEDDDRHAVSARCTWRP